MGSESAALQEIDAMSKIAAALAPLAPRERIRALWWALAKCCPEVPQHVTDALLSHGREPGEAR